MSIYKAKAAFKDIEGKNPNWNNQEIIIIENKSIWGTKQKPTDLETRGEIKGQKKVIKSRKTFFEHGDDIN